MAKLKPKPPLRPVPIHKPQGLNELRGMMLDAIARARGVAHLSTEDGKHHAYLFQYAVGITSDVAHSPNSQAALGSLAEMAAGAAIQASLQVEAGGPLGAASKAFLEALVAFRNPTPNKENAHVEGSVPASVQEEVPTLTALKEAVTDLEALEIQYDSDGGAGADAEGSAEG